MVRSIYKNKYFTIPWPCLPGHPARSEIASALDFGQAPEAAEVAPVVAAAEVAKAPSERLALAVASAPAAAADAHAPPEGAALDGVYPAPPHGVGRVYQLRHPTGSAAGKE